MIKSLTKYGISKIRHSFAYKKNLNGIYMSNEFNRLLNFQKNFSNREGYEFSLLVFYTRSKSFIWKPNIIQEIIARSRSVDKVGWFDNERIGIILPYTSVEGAGKIASVILHDIKDIEDAEYFIFTYPSKKYINSDGKHYEIDLKVLIFLYYIGYQSRKDDNI